MSGIFKKALGLFVEFDEEPAHADSKSSDHPIPQTQTKNETVSNYKPSFNQGEIEKFEKHFEQLFNKANLPGPDYFEFWKMMETLEAHIPDEKVRISAVFSSLSIQGLTKEILVQSIAHYKTVIEKDKSEFEKAVAEKSKTELEARKNTVIDLDKKIVNNSNQIHALTNEISEAQAKIAILKKELQEIEGKLISSKGNYNTACDAMLNKLTLDIQKIQSTLA